MLFKSLLIAAAATMTLSTAYAAPLNLVVNGNFDNPNVGNSWGIFANGAVPGWSNTLNSDGIEIDHSSILGGAAYSGTTQSAELNGNTFDWISQTISGLSVGTHYALSWAYGDRPGSGPQQMDVFFGNQLVASNFGTGSHSTLTWTFTSVDVVSTAATETLTFKAVNTRAIGGNPSGGNELTAVSLVPEPGAVALLGLGLLSFAASRRKSAKARQA